MRYTYLVEIYFPDPYEATIFCICETEADAQEMVFSIESCHDADYNMYILHLELDRLVRPHHFPLDEEEQKYPTADYRAVATF